MIEKYNLFHLKVPLHAIGARFELRRSGVKELNVK